MSFLVISDTHKNIGRIIDFLNIHDDLQNIIHLGDLVRDANDLECCFPERRFFKIKGNNDFFDKAPNEMMLDIFGTDVFLCHGHEYNVKSSLNLLADRAYDKGASAVFFGHTHIFCDKVLNGVRLINPSNRGYVIIKEGFSVEYSDW